MLSDQNKKLVLEFYLRGLGPSTIAILARQKQGDIEKYLRQHTTLRDKRSHDMKNVNALKQELKEKLQWTI